MRLKTLPFTFDRLLQEVVNWHSEITLDEAMAVDIAVATELGVDYRFGATDASFFIPLSWRHGSTYVATTSLLFVCESNVNSFMVAYGGNCAPTLIGLENLTELPTVIVGYTHVKTDNQAVVYAIGRDLIGLLKRLQHAGFKLLIEACGICRPGSDIHDSWGQRGIVSCFSEAVPKACGFLGLKRIPGCYESHTLGPIFASSSNEADTISPKNQMSEWERHVLVIGDIGPFRPTAIVKRFNELGLLLPDGLVTLTVVQTSEDLTRIVGREVPRWAVAMAWGRNQILVLHPRSWPKSCPSSIEQIVAHELAHVILHQLCADAPVAVDEGFAMLVAGQLQNTVPKGESCDDPSLLTLCADESYENERVYDCAAAAFWSLLNSCDERVLVSEIIQRAKEGYDSLTELLIATLL